MSGPVANNIFRASGVVAAAGGGLNWNSTILTALTTFTVTVQNVSGNKYFIDGVQQQTLNLLEGFTYKFDQSDSSNSSHPLRFSTTSGGSHGGGSEYTTGVTTSGTPGSSGAYTQIVVASGAPVLYYYCTAHSGMGGQQTQLMKLLKLIKVIGLILLQLLVQLHYLVHLPKEIKSYLSTTQEHGEQTKLQ